MIHFGGCLMVVSGTGNDGEQTMKTADYLKSIGEQLHSYMLSVFPTGNRVFEQVNTLCHSA